MQHHLIDPRTGRPARSRWDEVTVAASTCLAADIAAKAAFLLLQLAWRLRADPSARNASALFHYSLVFLALLFTAVAVDTLIP